MLASATIRHLRPARTHFQRCWKTTTSAASLGKYAKRTETKTASWLSERLGKHKEVLEYIRPAKRELLLGLMFLPPALGASMALPYFIGNVIDTFTSDADSPKTGYMLTLLGISTVGALATMGRSYYINVSGEIIVRALRRRLFSNIINKEIVFFDKSKTGDLINRISTDTTVISNTMTESVSLALRGIATITVGSGFLFYTCADLAMVSTGSLLPLIILARFYGTFIKKETTRQLDVLGQATSSAEESIANTRLISLYNRQDFAIHRYDTNITETFEIGKKIAIYRGVFMGTTNLAMSISMLSVLGYGSVLVGNGAISAGTMTAFLLYMVNVAASMASLTSVYSSLMRALGANERIVEVLHSDHTAPRPVTGSMTCTNSFDLKFEDVTFAYPSRPENTILDQMTLSIPNGSSVAILGGSGSGKSTLINMIGRLYEPNSGRILLGGESITNYDLAYLREQVGVVTQDPVIFHTSIAENIAFGNPNKGLDEVVAAAKHANIHGFISSLPNGYDTIVGERGSLLSGGQKQRITIARAILKDPKILVLDEATSSLDTENEHLVQQALDRLMPGRTSIIITHRISTIQNTDFIALLENGKVAEFGTRDEILKMPESKLQSLLSQH